MICELGIMWKKAAVVYFKALFQHLSGET